MQIQANGRYQPALNHFISKLEEMRCVVVAIGWILADGLALAERRQKMEKSQIAQILRYIGIAANFLATMLS